MAADRVELTQAQLDILAAAPAGAATAANQTLENTKLDSIIGNTAAATPAGTNYIGKVGGTTFTVTATDLIRPNNATPYAQYDIIAHEASGTTVIFLDFDTGRVDSSGYITKARIETDRTAEAGQYRLLLFRVPETGLTTRLTNLGDNDIYPMKFANRVHRSSYIDFTTWITGGSGSDGALSIRDDLRIKYGLASGSSHIYGLLLNPVAQTPQAQQTYAVSLSFESNS